jgi:hypothetical protein
VAIHSGADANVNDTIGAAKSDVDITDAITKKHDGAAAGAAGIAGCIIIDEYA